MDGLDDMEMIDANANFDEEMQEDLPDEEIQEDFLDDEIQEDFPEEEIQEDLPDEEIQEDLPDEEIQQDFPDGEIQQDFPDPDLQRDAHVEVENVENLMVDVFPLFTFNLQGTGLDRRLRTGQDGNKWAWEQFLLVIAQTLRFKNTYAQMLSSFRQINGMFINSRMPTNMEQFWRLVNRRDENFTHYVICSICSRTLGEGKVPLIDCNCNPVQCGPNRPNQHLGNILYINIRSQLQQLLNKPGMAIELQYPYTREKQNEDSIEDVYDGEEYRRHSTDEEGFLHRNRHNYSLAIWVDGVSPVKSANVHIVPVFLQVLELSPRARQRNSLLAAVYVGPQKPSMSHYLAPISAELGNLFLEGVTWRPDVEPNVEITSRFMLLIVSADSEERYGILNMTRHNGDCGCTFCHVCGARDVAPVNPGGNLRVVYPLENEIAIEDRTNAEIRRDAEIAARTRRPMNGIQGRSALQPLLYVDLRIAQLLENLHALWRGNFTRLFKNVINPARENHLTPQDIQTISDRILTIRTPTKLSRLPRSLNDFANFTANGIRNVAWYYLLPCAHDILNPVHFRLFQLFAEATFILDKDSINRDELDRAERLLIEYRQLFQQTFPAEEWVYNLHLLRHAVRGVTELGPTFVASGFWFESLNRQVINYLTSPNDRATQVACRMLLRKVIEEYLDRPMTAATIRELRDLLAKERWDHRPNVAAGTYVQLQDRGEGSELDHDQFVAMEAAGINNIRPGFPIRKYTKFVKNGMVFQIAKGGTRYNNAIAYVNVPHEDNLNFVEITSIVSWLDGNRERKGILGIPFRTRELAFETSYMHVVDKLDNNLIFLPITDVILPGVLVEVNNQTYISRLSNRWNND